MAKVEPDAQDVHGADEPKARREVLYAIEGGSVEIWRNLRPNRRSDWGVIVRRANEEPSVVMIHEGNELAAAEAAAQGVLDTLRAGGSLELPARP